MQIKCCSLPTLSVYLVPGACRLTSHARCRRPCKGIDQTPMYDLVTRQYEAEYV